MTDTDRRLTETLRPIYDGQAAVTLHTIGTEERLRVVPISQDKGTVLSRALSADVVAAIAEGFEVPVPRYVGDGAASAPPVIGSDDAEVPEGLPAEAARTIAEGNAWAGVVIVSPDLAARWLERNTDNRPRSRSAVRRYAALMDGGRWLVSADAIAFDDAGKLVNGQHRLGAVVLHGSAVPMLVACGLSPAVFAVLDTGKPRTGADVLAIRGFTYASVCAAVVRSVSMAERGGLWTESGRMELDELVRRAEAIRADVEADAREASILADRGLRTGRVLTVSHGAFALHAFRRVGEGERAAVSAYLDRTTTGVGINALDDPAHAVRQAFLDDQRADVPMGRAERLAILLRGAAHAASGQPMKRARGRGAGAWPTPPVPTWPKQRPKGGAPAESAPAEDEE